MSNNRDFFENWESGNPKSPTWFQEESDRHFQIFIIIFSVIATVVIIGFISSLVCYCCAGCMLYKRRHAMMQRGSSNPGFVVSHQIHHRVGQGPPAYPVQEAQIPMHIPRPRPYDNPV